MWTMQSASAHVAPIGAASRSSRAAAVALMAVTLAVAGPATCAASKPETHGDAAKSSVQPAPVSLVDADLFKAGEGGYACYRLPNLVQLPADGKLLAIVQGRLFDCGDTGAMDVLSRRSDDNGVTWTAPQVVISLTTPASNVTVGTPTPVADLLTGEVHLFVCVNFTRVLLLTSGDEGRTWGKPRDLTNALVPPGWSGVFTGLPQGIQLGGSQDPERLILCANHLLTSGGGHSHTIYSDDHGSTWHNGAPVQPSHTGECSLAQTSAGVVMYARVWWDDSSNRPTRALAVSTDGGVSFSTANTSAFPGNPGCDSQGATIAAVIGGHEAVLVGSPWGQHHFPRQNYTVLVSMMTDTATGQPSDWAPLPGADPLWAGPSGYSSLLWPWQQPNTLFAFYERGLSDSNEALRLTQVPLPTRGVAV